MLTRMLRSILLIASLVLAACDSENQTSSSGTARDSLSKPHTDTGTTDVTNTNQTSSLLYPDHLLTSNELEPFYGDLDDLKERGVIRALVTYSKTDFFLADGEIKGLQAELLKAYEEELNKGIKKPSQKIQIVFIPVTFDQLIPALEQGLGDIAAALLTQTPERLKRVAFTENKASKINEVIVSYHSAPIITTPAELSGKAVMVLKGSSYAEHLKQLNQQISAEREPIAIIEADRELRSEDILEIVNAGIFPHTVIDEYKASLWKNILTEIRIEKTPLSEHNKIGWAVRKNNTQLRADLNRFIESRVKKGSLLGNILIKRYVLSDNWIKNPLLEDDRDKLIKLLPLFQKYATQYELPPLALAAQAYQESRLNQDVRSNRGAIGVMQLLPTTAADTNVGIKDITNLENNIHAGAKYMAFLKSRYLQEPGISPLNQYLMSLAAYNAGPANLNRMRKLTDEMGLDRNQWFGHVEIAAERIIGRETVKYVSNIYKYYTVYSLSKDLFQNRQHAFKQTITETQSD